MEEIIKKGLLEKKRGVYRLIQTHYEKEIEDMGVQFFIEWLAGKLDVEESKIRYESLVQARHRLKRDREKTGSAEKKENDDLSGKPEESILGFKQTDVESDEFRQRVRTQKPQGRNV